MSSDFNTVPAEGFLPWQQVRINTAEPSIARSYDYMLGGKDNFAADRRVCEAMIKAVPECPQMARENRTWIARVVRYLVSEANIRQIIDLGSGLPTANNVHDVAQSIAPDTRVVYVDNDPIVLAHGRAILAINDRTTVITADVRDPEAIFTHPDLLELIELEEPFAILLASVLHHLPEGDDQRVAAQLREQLRPGCHLAIANFHDPGDPRAQALEQAMRESGLGSGWFRPYPQHRLYFGDLELAHPGLCPVNEWRPDEHTATDSPVHHLYVGGVGYRSSP